MQNHFSSLPLSKACIDNLNTLEFLQMTLIQQQSLPHILNVQDVIAQAKTGSGKTVAFGIGLIHKLQVEKYAVQSLVLVPTRELANQIAQELRKLARFIPNVKVLTLTGGMPYKPQVNSLYHGAHIIIGTPGRVLKHLEQNNLCLKKVNTLVLDEADRMLDMGFSEDIHTIISHVPKNRQTLLFSATFPENIIQLSQEILVNPIEVSTVNEEEQNKITQHFYTIEESNKTVMLSTLFSHFQAQSVVLFCNRKTTCETLADDLEDLDFEVLVLHSDLEQKERDETLTLFANKSYPILIATDVAARGLHIDDVDVVINYDIAKDAQVHTHRIGRSARAGKSGVALTLVTNDQQEDFEEINTLYDEPYDLEVIDFDEDFEYCLDAAYRTLYINGGKKHKIRAGDILGMLIQSVGLQKEHIGKIDIFPFYSYVAIDKKVYEKTFEALQSCKIKGKYFKVYPR